MAGKPETMAEVLDEFGFEDGDECPSSPHGHHEFEGDWLFPGRATCFWCNGVPAPVLVTPAPKRRRAKR